MDRQFDKALTRLESGEFLRIRGGYDQLVAVFDGEVWITQENDLRDVFIGRGGSFPLNRPGLALVQALRPTKLLVLDAIPQAMGNAYRSRGLMNQLRLSLRRTALPAQPVWAQSSSIFWRE